ncbi:unnamed protein product [Meloidogyne enterolobii]|uniref:Uncharacterized protein n=1 Tax=Meloidogyne enterolobii TaxID=390850 RepID=A0ACB1A700_MELEN
MLIFAWLFSILFSLPQLFVWTTYNPFRNSQSQGWVQCTDIWSIDRYERYLLEQHQPNTNILQKNNSNWEEFVLSPLIQNGYELTHLFLVFYGPLIVLIICYALISTRLIRFAANNPRNIAKVKKIKNKVFNYGILS